MNRTAISPHKSLMNVLKKRKRNSPCKNWKTIQSKSFFPTISPFKHPLCSSVQIIAPKQANFTRKWYLAKPYQIRIDNNNQKSTPFSLAFHSSKLKMRSKFGITQNSLPWKGQKKKKTQHNNNQSQISYFKIKKYTSEPPIISHQIDISGKSKTIKIFALLNQTKKKKLKINEKRKGTYCRRLRRPYRGRWGRRYGGHGRRSGPESRRRWCRCFWESSRGFAWRWRLRSSTSPWTPPAPPIPLPPARTESPSPTTETWSEIRSEVPTNSSVPLLDLRVSLGLEKGTLSFVFAYFNALFAFSFSNFLIFIWKMRSFVL